MISSEAGWPRCWSVPFPTKSITVLGASTRRTGSSRGEFGHFSHRRHIALRTRTSARTGASAGGYHAARGGCTTRGLQDLHERDGWITRWGEGCGLIKGSREVMKIGAAKDRHKNSKRLRQRGAAAVSSGSIGVKFHRQSGF